jgi:hypothetical protein
MFNNWCGQQLTICGESGVLEYEKNKAWWGE